MSTYFIKCTICDKTFESKAHNALYCTECRKAMNREQSKAYDDKKRGYSMVCRAKIKNVSFKEGLHKNIEGNNKWISQVAKNAREAGMSYGQYMARLRG